MTPTYTIEVEPGESHGTMTAEDTGEVVAVQVTRSREGLTVTPVGDVSHDPLLAGDEARRRSGRRNEDDEELIPWPLRDR
jgi:hypothetical protein